MTPKIDGVDASRYLRDVPDNGRVLIIRGDHPDAGYEHLQLVMDELFEYEIADMVDDMCINASGRSNPELYNYMVTLHSSHNDFSKANFDKLVHESTMVIGLNVNGVEHKRVDMKLGIEPAGGTSALLACVAGCVLGYKRIHMVGVRLEPGTIYYDKHVYANWLAWEPVLRDSLHVYQHYGWLNCMFNKRGEV